MKTKIENIFASGLKAFACFAIVFSLVLSSSSSHAASGAHGDHYAPASNDSHQHMDHSHSEMALASEQAESDLSVALADETQTSGSCCNGICVTAVLDEAFQVVLRRAQSARFQISHAHAASFETFGFLRPPQILI